MKERAERRILTFCAIFLVAGVLSAEQPSDEPPPPPRNASVEQLQVVYRYQNDGTGEVTRTERLRILTDFGLKMYGAVYVAYSGELEDLRIDYLRTVKADGTVIPADPAKAMDLTPPVTRFAPMFSDVRMKVLVAPQAQVGDAIEYQYTRTIREPYMAGNFWVMHSLDRANPIRSATIVLDVPAGRKLSFESDPCFHYTVEKQSGRKLYRWQIANLEPPEISRTYPPLFAASTLSDWKQVADWYAGLQSDGVRVTPEIQALASKLTAGKTTPRQKLDAIYAYVSEKIRYVALEFGIGGYQAHAAGAVEASGYGDCKDKSGLLEALLAAAGIKAYQALVNAASDTIETVAPMPSQFNHVMTVAEIDGKDLWLDSTMETAPPGVLSPAVLGKQALLIEPGASRFVTVPDSPPAPPHSTVNAAGSVDRAGKLTLKNSVEVEGINGVLMRQVFRLQDKNQLANVVKRMSQFEVAGAVASDWSSSDPDDLSGPFKYEYTLSRAGYFDLLQKDEKIQVPRLSIGPNQWRASLSTAEEEKKEEEKAGSSAGCATNPPKDIKLGGPYEIQEALDLAIPSNYQVELPEPIEVERPFGSYASSYSFDRGRLTVRRVLKIDAAKIPLFQIDALRNFQDLVNADLSQQPTLRRTGSSDILSDAGSMTTEELNTAGLEALDKHHNPALARDLLLKAVAKDPKSEYAWNNLGRAYAAIGNYYQAEKAYKKQAAIHPYDPYAYNNLGLVEAAEQHLDAAIADYKQQLSVNPLDRVANNNLAAAYNRKRDWSDAAAAYAPAVRVSPGDPLLVAAWGTALLRAGKSDDGRRAMARALEISKQPVVLNNTAYGMAQAGVDLAKAEEYARSAVDQTIPENVASLDVPKNYAATLGELASYLDTLGFTLYQEDKLSDAGPCLRAAFEIWHGPDMARHLAMLAMKQNNPAEALRYYSDAVAQLGEEPPHVPRALTDYLKSHGALPQMTAPRVAEIQKQEQGIYRLAPPAGRSFTWPKAAATAPAWVALNVLVDAQGNVTEAKVFRGSEPFGSAARSDVRQVRFPPLAWANHSLATIRTAFFLYDPGAPDAAEKVMAFSQPGGFSEPDDPSLENNFDLLLGNTAAGFFIVQGHVQAGLDVLRQEAKSGKNLPDAYRFMVIFARQMRRAGNLEAAAGVLREAVPLQPKDDFAYRELAETLKTAGDRPGTIEAYQQLIQLDPDDARAHYSLGAEYEAEAGADEAASSMAGAKHAKRAKGETTRKSREGKGGETAFQAALEQYSLAASLDPGNATYRSSYQTLYEQVYHHPPPASADGAGAPANP